MKTLYPEYFKPNDDDFKHYWKNGLFSFDTCALLNAYGYSQETRNKYLEIIGTLTDRVWLTNHVVSEYLRNRPNKIFEQRSHFKSAEEYLTNLKAEAKRTADSKLTFRNHPVIDKAELLKEIESSLDMLLGAAKTDMEKYPIEVDADPLLDNYLTIFDSRLGPPFALDQEKAIYLEGKERYKAEIPPGYEDLDKPEPRRYGDLIIWKQLLDKGLAEKLPVIFITDDDKEDWWWKSKKKRTLGPRIELIKEMMTYAKVPFWMYSVDRFMKYAEEFLDIEVEDDQIQEAETMRKESTAVTNLKRGEGLLDLALGRNINYDLLKRAMHNRDFAKEAVEAANAKSKIFDFVTNKSFTDELTKKIIEQPSVYEAMVRKTISDSLLRQYRPLDKHLGNESVEDDQESGDSDDTDSNEDK